MKAYIIIVVVFLMNVKGLSQFNPQKIITEEADGTQSIFIADIDGDGYKDVISANKFGSSITWFKNLDGLGNYGPQNTIAFLSETIHVHAADLDGDNDMDVLAAAPFIDTVVWYENLDGLGDFSAPKVISNTADGAFSVKAVDIDGDGDQDVMFASENSNIIYYRRNLDGQGTFGDAQTVADEANNGRHFDIGDIDGDGDMDVVASSSGTEIVTWFENTDGQGGFGPPNIINSQSGATSSVFLADLDNDNDLDLVTASPADDEVAWYENIDGQGTFGSKNTLTLETDFVRTVFAADLDNDGDNDILSISSIDGKIALFENIDGQGQFSDLSLISTDFVSGRDIKAADIDNDGDIDVIAASQNLDKIAWYENLTILNVKENKLQNVRVHPNPSNGLLIVDALNITFQEATIYDALGKKVYFKKSQNLEQLDISILPTGVYFLNLVSGKEAYTVKVIKE
ncbi:T9SS type A sorting domain-containing protein [Marixanthomonas spongiae]|uniref:Secretion system C-terminal sorting domain-containing protein n=1 Tax=Marixanthomonas spongiae TaxID=2174845 RepID=A0A2U0I5Q5_9FLAO|nr:T9SS type A sorting domain-containing protein [Marixanthomonas spongiae]PVW16436.1 hypothetical protein DDV96_04040 [Marixanthomonas spongiae]